jgi:hypothetical protein
LDRQRALIGGRSFQNAFSLELCSSEWGN